MNGNKGSRRRRGVNFFDLFVLLLVVAVGLLAAYFIRGTRVLPATGGTPIEVTYKVEISNVSEQVRDSAKAGVAVRDGVRKSMLGEITEVSASPAFQMKADMETGEVKRAEIEGRYNVTVTCKAQGQLRDGRVVINEYTLGVGTQVALQSAGISGVGYCVALDYVETEQ